MSSIVEEIKFCYKTALEALNQDDKLIDLEYKDEELYKAIVTHTPKFINSKSLYDFIKKIKNEANIN